MQKKQNRAALEEEKTKRQQAILDKQALVSEKKAYLFLLKERKAGREVTQEKAKQALLDEDIKNDTLATQILVESQKEELQESAALDAEIAARCIMEVFQRRMWSELRHI